MFYRPKETIYEALQYLPQLNKLPEGMEYDNIEKNTKVARVQTEGGMILVHPKDWVIYDRAGDIRGVLKNDNFQQIFEWMGS